MRTLRAIVHCASLERRSLNVHHKWTFRPHVVRQPCNQRYLFKCLGSLLLNLLAHDRFLLSLQFSCLLQLQLRLLPFPLITEFLGLATLLFEAPHFDSSSHSETRLLINYRSNRRAPLHSIQIGVLVVWAHGVWGDPNTGA